MEKYQDLIITLIKNHRRFPGCEGIVNEIAEEVINKASSVIETVADEEITRKYLIKMVSTAMIIVPKRHNINTRPSKVIPVPTETTLVENAAKQEEVQPIITAACDSAEDEHSEDTVSETENEHVISENSSAEELTDIAEDDLVLIEESVSENLEEAIEPAFDEQLKTDLSESDNELICEELLETEQSESDNTSDNVLEETISDDIQSYDNAYNKALVDKMINGLGEETEVSAEEEIATIDDLEEVKVLDLDENESLPHFEEINEDISLLFSDGEDDNQELIEEDILDSQDDEPVKDDWADKSEEIGTEEIEIIESSESSEDTEQKKSSEAVSFTLPDFSCFGIEAKSEDYDTEDVVNNINEYDKKYPDKHIKEILELKYSKCISVEEIAKELNIEIGEVLETINDLIDIVEV